MNVHQGITKRSELIPQPPCPCESVATCEKPTKTTQNPLNQTRVHIITAPPYDSGCAQTQNNKGKEKNNLKTTNLESVYMIVPSPTYGSGCPQT